ncbi:SDR family NAD(P)-dependent oxidoreductase [Aliifodinibius sp. S!AR15-10]|uniref:SDR family NAD(P)-dependent oxidoreductase n=1 Tax=Aliifodinibius sp. S!AR15-10 TaxID=2950437 RepID=UPI00286615E2|nr:SDR family NAD(P)-dependent oxidoreductase [Aliifodinibius sp. S!AR15-10]MDR8394443.1 SDR family NAD(P)-dependent oxidoreductase [Aliifodinibius sp. S!AR15-10]
MKQVKGKTALITGASRGIGLHIAQTLAEKGMNLVLTARSASALEQAADDARVHGVSVNCIVADLRHRSEVENLAKRAESESDGIAVLINNAAIESALPYDKVDLQMIEEMVRVNLTSPMILTRLLLPYMIQRGQGHIVHISSVSGLVGTPYEEAYGATKHGLVGFSRCLRLTLESEGHPIGVSVICPAFVEDAGMYHEASTKSNATAPVMMGTVPLQKVGAAVVKAIIKNKREVVLTGKPIIPFLLTQTISPKLADRISAFIGVSAMFKKWAETSLKSTRQIKS